MMAPHAVSASFQVSGYTDGTDTSPELGKSSSYSTQSTNLHHINVERNRHRSHLHRTPEDELHDLICVGFGPASLAVAVALHDALDSDKTAVKLSALQGRPPKVAILERQPQFAWHAGMLLEGAKMQISFIKDMATLRDPRSAFTFLNYLHENDRLVPFTNLSTFLPQRVEYEAYMRWCASWFEDVAAYNQDVIDVRPEKRLSGSKLVDTFAVTSKNVKTQQISTRRTRHVVIAVGGKPNIPKPFPQKHPRVVHSSQYSHTVPQILKDFQYPYKVAVVGGGQSAAEIFENLHNYYPNSQTRLVIKGAALKPSDDSPFVNEVFDPDRVNVFYNQDPTSRAACIASDRNTNYGVVRLELLERLYETLYTQRLRYDSEKKWPHRILSRRSVVRAEESSSGGISLYLRHGSGHPALQNGQHDDYEVQDFDLVVVAAGYTRDAHEDLLAGARHLMPGGDEEGKKWGVERNYRVRFAEDTVSQDAGVWLQGCNEGTHGLADTLLSILAVRGGEVVQSIFGHDPMNGTAADADIAKLDLNGRSNGSSRSSGDGRNGQFHDEQTCDGQHHASATPIGHTVNGQVDGHA